MNIPTLTQSWRRRWIAIRNSPQRPQRPPSPTLANLPSVKICLITSEWVGFMPVKYAPGHAEFFQSIPKEKRLFMPYDVRYQLRAGYIVKDGIARQVIQDLAARCQLLLYPEVVNWLPVIPPLATRE